MRYSLGAAVVLASLWVAGSANAGTVLVTTDGDVNTFELRIDADRQAKDTFFGGDDVFETLDVFSTHANDRMEFGLRENIDQWTLRNKADAPIALRDMPDFHLVLCSPVIGGCIGDDVIGDIAGPAPNAEFIYFLHSLHI